MGADNRNGLPPVLPRYGTLGLFCHMLARCFPDAYTANLPWTLGSSSSPAGTYSDNPVSDIASLGAVIGACLGYWSSPVATSSPVSPLEPLGKHLMALASLPPADFVMLTHSTMLARIAGYTNTLSRIRQQSYASLNTVWTGDAEDQLQRLHRTPTDQSQLPVSPVMLNSPEGLVRIAGVQEAVRMYGSLLTWWPAILEKAMGLSNAGFSLAVPL